MRLIKPANRVRRYHLLVTRFFILLLIALLPLRGWAVDRMALQMEGGVPQIEQSQSAEAAMDNTAMDEDCPHHTLQGQHSAQASQVSQAKTCHSCQLCMAMAALELPPFFSLPAAPRLLPPTRVARFASADPARHAKPPIS